MVDVTMNKVISKFNIDMKNAGKNEFKAYCPVCGKTEGRRTLNINPVEEKFHCFRCGAGGRTNALYCLYMGWDITEENQKRAFKELIGDYSFAFEGGNKKAYKAFKGDTTVSFVSTKNAYENEDTSVSKIASIDVRHKTYSALLEELGLATEHRKNLLQRGLTEDEIVRLGYKTSPTKNPTVLCELLIEKGCTLEGVPGFYKDSTGKWSVVGSNERGILIPFKNTQGKIQGLHKRLDNTENGKFRWFSSGGFNEGTKAENWIHFAGEFENRSVIITEGAMKADIISTIKGGKAVLAVPGVNSIQKLEDILIDLKNNKGINRIETVFDMDYITNEQVERAYNNLLGLLKKLDIEYHKQVWSPCYKGYDDYLAMLYRGVFSC